MLWRSTSFGRRGEPKGTLLKREENLLSHHSLHDSRAYDKERGRNGRDQTWNKMQVCVPLFLEGMEEVEKADHISLLERKLCFLSNISHRANTITDHSRGSSPTGVENRSF